MLESKNPTGIANSEIKSLFLVLYRYSWIILLFVAFAVVGAFLHYHIFPQYKATASLHIQSPEFSPLMQTVSKLTDTRVGNSDLSEKYLKVIHSRTFSEYLLRASEQHPDEVNRLRGQIENSVGIKSILDRRPNQSEVNDADFITQALGGVLFKQTDHDMIEINSRHQRPEQAVAAANFFIKMAKKAIVAFEAKELEDAEEYLKSELDNSKERLNVIYKKISDLETQRKKDVAGSMKNGDLRKSIMDRLQEELEISEVQLSQYEVLTKNLTKEVLQSVRANRNLANRRAPVDLNSATGRPVERLKSLEDKKEAIRANIFALKTRLMKHYAKPVRVEGRESFEFEKELELEHDLQKMLRRSLFDNKVQGISVDNRIRIHLLAPVGSASRVSPLGIKLLFAAIGSFIFIALMIFFWEHIYPVITNRNQLAEMGLKFLGNIPLIDSKESKKKKLARRKIGAAAPGAQAFLGDCLINPGVPTESSLAFHYLRARLEKVLNHQRSNNGSIISLISPMVQEGKSIVASNLALSFSSTGRKTLIVDCDLHKSTLSNIFNLDTKLGLTDFLNGGLPLKKAIRKDIIPGLDFMDTGTNDYSRPEVFSEDRLKEFLGHVRKYYDVILLDTPAFLSGPDGLLVASASDIPLMVVNSNATRLQEVEDVVESLLTHNLTNIFAVLNRHRLPFTRNPYRTYIIPEGELYEVPNKNKKSA